LVADESGGGISTFEGGASAIRPGQVARSAEVIAQVVRSALASIDTKDIHVRTLVVGVAGAGRPAPRSQLAAHLRDAGLADEIIVETDATIAMEDAFGHAPGIVLIAGTGSVAYGRSPTGAFARCGGWGGTSGDEGGGYWLGRRALSAVTAAHDGREPETSLTGAVLTAVEGNAVEDLVAWSSAAEPEQIASLAAAVLQQAGNGDLRANTLVSLAAEELVLHVRTLARRLFADERAEVPVALAGGLLSAGSFLRNRVELRLRSGVPGAVLHNEAVVPERGAVRYGLRTLAAEHS
jgi:glucosamine kinase